MKQKILMGPTDFLSSDFGLQTGMQSSVELWRIRSSTEPGF